MLKKNLHKKIVLALSPIMMLPMALLHAQPVAAATSMFDQMAGGLKTMVKFAYGGGTDINVGPNTFRDSLISIINSLLTFVGVIFFLLLIYAGWLWMNARGREDEVERAKRITREVVIGLIIIILARIITEFILTQIKAAVPTT